MNEKFFFESIVRLNDGTVTPQLLGYDTSKDAEIKFYDEVSYALKLDNLKSAHFEVHNEKGDIVDNLSKTIEV